MPKLMDRFAGLTTRLATYIPNREQRAEMWAFARRYKSHPEDLGSVCRLGEGTYWSI